MSLMCLLIAVAGASELRFHPGPGRDTVVLDDPSRLVGGVLARTTAPEALAARSDVASVRRLGGSGRVSLVMPVAGLSPVVLANRLHADPAVRWAHPDLRLQITATATEAEVPDDPYFARQWHLINDGQRGYVPGVDVNAAEAWAITTGAGVLVAVLDSGTDLDHPDLDVIDGGDFIESDGSADPLDGNNHGTAVAGIIAAIGNNGLGTTGIAYDAQIYGTRLIGGAPLSATYQAFVQAVDAGAAVINNSWGVENSCNGLILLESLREAFDYAEEVGRDGLGTVNVFAAGNQACDVTRDEMLAHPAVVGVAAVSGFDVRESYSNFGPWVDIAAPSGGIVTTDIAGPEGGNPLAGDEDYVGNFGGTSAASPMVAGVAALMIAANPRLRAAEVREVLCATAVPVDLGRSAWDDLGWSPEYGCGRVDAGAAVRAVANLGPPDVPEVAPALLASPDAVRLTWSEAADPDGDWLRYRVRWSIEGERESGSVELVERTWLDLTGLVDDGQTVVWQVRAVDPWGGGEWSAEQRLGVRSPPVPAVPEARGCAHAPLPGLAGVSLLGLLALHARRRRR